VQNPRTLQLQATPSVDVREWHNQGGKSYGGCSSHLSIEIAWSVEGAIDYAVGSQRSTLQPGAAMIVPAAVEHTTYVRAGTRAKVLGLSPSLVDEVADAANVRPRLCALLAEERPRLLSLGALVFEEATGQSLGQDLALDALTEALAIELLRVDPTPRAGKRSPQDPRIRRAVDFIGASFAEPISLDAMAKVAGMSRFYFGRCFLADVGVSPYHYLVDVRIARAEALLRGGRMSVTAAALSVGFNDLGRFGRAFRARFGVSPRDALAASVPRRAASRERPGGARSA
jgi:AraC-like DNA-binding protein